MKKKEDIQPQLHKANVSRRFIVGQKIPLNNVGWLKIMAYADGYYMARFKSCIPFCCREDEIQRRIELYGG